MVNNYLAFKLKEVAQSDNKLTTKGFTGDAMEIKLFCDFVNDLKISNSRGIHFYLDPSNKSFLKKDISTLFKKLKNLNNFNWELECDIYNTPTEKLPQNTVF